MKSTATSAAKAMPQGNFLRQALGTYGTQLLMTAIGLVSSIAVARALGPAGRGEYAVAMAIGLIGVQLGNLGLHSSNSYFVAKDRTLLPTLVGNSLVASLVLGGAETVLLFTVFHFWRNAPLHGALLWLAALWVPLGLAYLLGVNLLVGLLEIRLYNAIELLNRLLATVLVCCVIWRGIRSPESTFVAMLAGLAISLFVVLRKLRRLSGGSVALSIKLFRQNFQLGWKAYLSCFFAFLVIRIDLLMVRSMLGPTEAGYYSIAGTLADYVLILPAAVGAILFPRLSSLSDDTRKRSLTLQAVAGTGLGLLALLLVLGVSIKFTIVMFFGKLFAPAAVAFLLLTPGILFLGLETIVAQYLNSCGFPMSVVVLWILSTLLNVVLNLWAIPIYGIKGAAAVSSISYAIALLGVIWISVIKGKATRSAERPVFIAAN